MTAIPCMARSLALLLVALLPQQCFGAATTDSELHRLRGQRHAHRRHRRALLNAQTSSYDDSLPKEESSPDVTDGTAPLYDDFLDIMNNAAAQALSQQRAIPAYDDFLHYMKHSAEKAYKEQKGIPSYDEFLGFMKRKSDEAYQQQVETPSYDDFLIALKESSMSALRVPVPTYEEFLTLLKDAAERAMHQRVRQQENSNVVQFSNTNPLDKVGEAMKRTKRQMEGKKADDDDHKLREELRRLQREKKKHKKKDGTVPDHVKKPLMKRINVLRTQLCWKRPNLWQHEKCLRFLGLHCLQESTGEGICKAFTKKAKEKCETSNDPRWREDYCALSEALSESYDTEEEEEEEEQEEEAIAEEKDDETEIEKGEDESISEESDIEDEHIGDDDDLEKELDEMDRELAESEREEEKAPPPPPEITPRVAGDRDNDGVPDEKDKFPDDPNEWEDIDGDGIGDNADNDRDGDGYANEVDAFPADPKEWKDTDGDGIGDNADDDRDNDGVKNDKDKFPDDPTEWLDTDGDGVGDNKDAYPFNPNCHSHDEPCEDVKEDGKPKKGGPQDPSTLDKDAGRALPAQGFNEHMSGPPVAHRNYYTWVSDWQDEFPDMEESERRTMAKICEEHPDNSWCEKFAHRDGHFR